MAAGGATIAEAGDRLLASAEAAGTVGELFAAASTRLSALVPFDAAVWLATDPATGLPTAPTHAENMSHFGVDHCRRGWELEFMVEDVNLYSALARAPVPAAGLRLATGDRPARSPRFRELIRPFGFDDELRGVLRADGRPWGLLALFRTGGRPAFDDGERELVGALCAPLAAAVRDHARPAARRPRAAGECGPGLMIFAPGGELISVNDDALAWLDELPGDESGRGAFDVPLPMIAVSTLMRARAIAAERDRGSARARIRSRSGDLWLVCHASCLREQDGTIGNTALVIEPAKSSEIVPIIAAAYALSRRELQVTQRIALGFGTAEIAERLHLSTHTVRDYVKRLFDKVGVSSRGELVAKLFAEHYGPMHFAPDARDASRPRE